MKNDFDPKYQKIKEFENSSFNSFIKGFFTNQISEMKNFREINCKDIILNNIDLSKKKNPDISVIITVYNQANCFHSALRSVQNQSLKNIEIIIIDDCSLDNSTEIIEKYMEEDNRIIFLKQESNHGKIKSRSNGVRIAKGKYITIIDGDDSLSNENILLNCFTIATLADLDIVGFNFAFYIRKKFKGLNIYKNIKNINNRIIYQPELYYKFVSFEDKDSEVGFVNRNIWSKLIKNNIFKRVLEYIGSKYADDYIQEYEDTIMSVSLFRIANSYYYFKDCGYYYAINECENAFPILKSKKCKSKNYIINKELDPIKYLNFLIDRYKDNEFENFLLYKELISIDNCKHLENYINSNFSYVCLIIEKIYEINYSYKKREEKISKIKDKLLNKDKMIKLNKSHINSKIETF